MLVVGSRTLQKFTQLKEDVMLRRGKIILISSLLLLTLVLLCVGTMLSLMLSEKETLNGMLVQNRDPSLLLWTPVPEKEAHSYDSTPLPVPRPIISTPITTP